MVRTVAYIILLAVATQPMSGQFLKDVSPVVWDKDTVETGLTVLLISHTTLQMADLVTTLYGLENGHTEANYLMAPIADKPAVIIPVKIGVTLGINYIIKEMYFKDPTVAYSTAFILNVFYLIVVSHNINILINF